MKIRSKVGFSLQVKVVITAVAALALLVIALVLFFSQRINQAVAEASQKRAVAIATGLANECEYGLLVGNKAMLQHAAYKTLAQADVVSAVVFNDEGKVMAAAGPVTVAVKELAGPHLITHFGQGKVVEDASVPPEENQQVLYAPVLLQPSLPAADVGPEEIPVSGRDKLGRRLGLIELTVSLASTDLAAQRARWDAWSLAGISLLALGLLCALVVRRMVQPLRALVAGTEQLATGNLAVRVTPSSSDEIGELAMAFNNMADRLQESQRELLDHQQTLQQRVAAGTNELRAANEQLRSRATRQMTINELSQRALTATDLAELMKELVARAVRTLDLECCAIMELTADGDTLVMREGLGWNEGVVGNTRVPAGNKSMSGYTLLQAEPVVVEDFRAETRFSVPGWIAEHGLVCGLATIIPGRDRPYGVLSACNVRRRKFTEDDVYFLQAMANVLSSVIERRRLEEQFLQAQKMEGIGRLAGGVAHDFNNILTAVIGQSDMLLRRLAPDDPLRDKVKEIWQAADRAAALTRQLLAFSRKQALQPKVLDLNAVVADMEKMLRRLIGENIQLSTVGATDLGRVQADRGQIEQVIMNLVVNARDAMPNGGMLTIQTGNITLGHEYARHHVDVKPGDYVLLSVSDTGSGMSPETKAHLFEPFFTTKGLGRGTGLGLATCYGIIKQSGGHIGVDSELGQGTTFKVYLPCCLLALETQAVREESDAMPRSPTGKEVVLLAEDEALVRELAGTVLRELGYTVLEANNGEDALQLAARQNGHGIDLLLTDVVMPNMSGKELAERLIKTHPKLRVLFSSGYTDDAIGHHGVLSANIAYLQKPYTPGSLARKVHEVLTA